MSDNTPVLSFFAPPFPYYTESGEARFEPGEQHPNRTGLGVFDLLFVVKGTLHIGEESSHWSLRRGDALVLLPDKHHYPVKPCEESTEFYWVHFQSPNRWQEGERLPGANAIVLAKQWAVADFDHAERLIRKLIGLAVKPRSLSLWEEQSAFWDLLRYMEEGGNADNQSPSRLIAEKAEAYIKRFYPTDVTNETLANALHFHPNYVTRCMKEVYGCTPMSYLNRYRIEQAQLLLLKTEGGISSIAEQVGFRYAPYFSNCFRKLIGESPMQYRRRYTGGSKIPLRENGANV
ncbi:helix-turn-helix transcriptional regulator [Cohnella endophytica]|uniref:helix-turn-helix transcriptional regulator n=1 Tax=Cohnella endophytica TaxID=2419778 RepID=UPI001F26372B|nr:AraC family transcriptional regulator [Cohnella endophytica]